MKRAVIWCVAVAGVLWYLHDPAWLRDMSSGLRAWEQAADGRRYRWSGGHASFFVPSDAGKVRVPVSTTFGPQDPRPMVVTFTVDDRRAARILLTDPAWRDVVLRLPPPGGRRVRRIDIRTDITREDNHGVRVAEIAPASAPPGSTR